MLFRLGQYIIIFFFKVFFRIQCFGLENVPTNGPLLVVANHASNLDPPLCGVYLFFKRDMHFLAKKELFKNKILGWFITSLNTHPIRRGQVDRQAMKTVLDLLGKGNALMLFPEGTRSRDGNLQPGKSGVGFLIYQAQAPVLPVYIDNTFKILPRGKIFPRPCKVRVLIGEAQVWRDLLGQEPDKELYQAISDRCMEEINKLKSTLIT